MILRLFIVLLASTVSRGQTASSIYELNRAPTTGLTASSSINWRVNNTPTAIESDDSIDSLDSDDSDLTDSSDSTDSIDPSHSFSRSASAEDSSERDDDSDESTTSSALSNAMVAALKFGGVLNATSTIESSYVNWVGTALDTSKVTACYRKTHIAKTCPVGYNRKLGTCWAQCPYAYPVQCGMECIRQNDDCALEIVTKVSALAQTTLSFITYDVFGKLSKLARAVQVAIKCAKYTMGLIKALAKYVRNIKVTDPQTPEDKILAMLYQTDNVVVDIPIAVSYCIGSYASDEIKIGRAHV